jgi:hypothetical protein
MMAGRKGTGSDNVFLLRLFFLALMLLRVCGIGYISMLDWGTIMGDGRFWFSICPR